MLFSEDRRRKIDPTIFLPALVLAVQSIPWFAVRFRMRVLAPVMLAYMVISLARYRARVKSEHALAVRMMIGFVLYAVSFLILQALANPDLFYTTFVVHVFAFFFLWVFVFLASDNRIREIKILALIEIVSLGVTASMGATFLSEETNREILRGAAAGMANMEDLRDAAMSGAGGYSSVYAVGLVVPALVYVGLNTRKWVRWLFFAVAGFATVYCQRAGFSIILVVIGFGFVLVAVAKIVRDRFLFHLVALLNLTLLLTMSLYPDVGKFLLAPLGLLAKVTDNPFYKMRIDSIIDSISGGGGNEYALERIGTMWASFQSFCQAPLFGSTFSNKDLFVGGHSLIGDYLAQGGLFFFSFFVGFFVLYCKYMKFVVFPVSRSAFFLLGLFSYMFLMCTLLNPLNSSTVWGFFFLVIPGLTFYFRDAFYGYAKHGGFDGPRFAGAK